MKTDGKSYPVEVVDGEYGKEMHIGFPKTGERAVVALDAFRENGGDAPCLQLLVYEAGGDGHAVAVRFNDDGRIAEAVFDPRVAAMPQGAVTAWQEQRDGGMDRHGTLVVENVDLELLDEQRLALSRAIGSAEAGRPADKKEIYLLDGLRNMLDAWSDGRAAAAGEESP